MGRVLCSVLYEGLPSFGLHMQHRQTTEKWVGRSTEEASEDVLHAACGQWITRKRLQHPPRRQEKASGCEVRTMCAGNVRARRRCGVCSVLRQRSGNVCIGIVGSFSACTNVRLRACLYVCSVLLLNLHGAALVTTGCMRLGI